MKYTILLLSVLLYGCVGKFKMIRCDTDAVCREIHYGTYYETYSECIDFALKIREHTEARYLLFCVKGAW